MFTTNTDTLRRSIRQLELGRAAMMAAPCAMFNWQVVGQPECDTPGCCWGYTKPATGMGIFDDWWPTLGLPYHWSRLVFWMPTSPYIQSRTPAAERIIGLRNKTNKRDRDTANIRMKMLIDRLRHRLAVCEVEQGEWGQQLKAADLPVGLERENAVARRETICV